MPGSATTPVGRALAKSRLSISPSAYLKSVGTQI